jgi:Ca2+-binding EF-hand superfamily protein
MPTRIKQKQAVLARIQMCFDCFSTAGQMNQSQFTKFLAEMEMTNSELVPRLFHVFDRDNTGALEVVELAEGLRLMCEYSYNEPQAAERRNRFAFHLLDQDRGGLVEVSEVEDFIDSFHRAASTDALAWIGVFESIFGSTENAGSRSQPPMPSADHPDVGSKLEACLENAAMYSEEFLSISNFGKPPTVEEIGALLKGNQLEGPDYKPLKNKTYVMPNGKVFIAFRDGKDSKAKAKHQDLIAKAATELDGLQYNGNVIKAEACSGIDASQFEKWCKSSGDDRINIVAWLRSLGDSWIRKMDIIAEMIVDGSLITERADNRSAVKLPGIITAQYDEATRGAIDNCFVKYAVDGHLYRRGFIRCLSQLGMANSALLDRMFKVFDPRGRQFLDHQDFQSMFQALIESGADEKDRIVFSLMDLGGNGYVTRSALAAFVSAFFENSRAHFVVDTTGEELSAGRQTVFGVLRTLFPCAAIGDFSVAAQQSITGMLEQYQNTVVAYAFSGAPGDRLYFDQFRHWTQGTCRFWLAGLCLRFVSNLSAYDEGGVELETTAPSVMQLKKDLQNPARAGTLNLKPAGAAKSCNLNKSEVKILQDLFRRLTAGVMTLQQWQQIFDRCGIINGNAAKRLFLMFDGDGNRQMSSIEFVVGLSEIIAPTDTIISALKFYDSSHDVASVAKDTDRVVSRRDFRSFLYKFRNMCAESIKHSAQQVYHVYGIDIEQLDVSDAAVRSRHSLLQLFDDINEELNFYCDDIWDHYAGVKEEKMKYKAFERFVTDAPAVSKWLEALGADIRQQLPSLKDFHPRAGKGQRHAGHEPVVLSDYKMAETFDQHAFPKQIDNADRTLITIRTTKLRPVLAGKHELLTIASGFAADVTYYDLGPRLSRDTGCNVDLIAAMVRAEAYDDVKFKLAVSVTEFRLMGHNFINALASQINIPETNIWVLGDAIDAGPTFCYATVRFLGDQPIPSTLQLVVADAPLATRAHPIELRVVDTTDVVFSMEWSVAEIERKITGPNGIRQTLATDMQQDVQNVLVSVTEVNAGLAKRARIRVAVTRSAPSDVVEGKILAAFPTACAKSGLASPRQELYFDSKIALSNLTVQQFATLAQTKFKDTLANALKELVCDTHIIEIAWPSPKRTIVHVRFYMGTLDTEESLTEANSIAMAGFGWKTKLSRKLHEIISNGDFNSELRRKLLDVDAGMADSVDSIFSLKTDFVQSMKKEGAWSIVTTGIRDEYDVWVAKQVSKQNSAVIGASVGVHSDADSEDDHDDYDDCSEVIAGTMNEQQFVDCIKTMQMANPLVARRLFATFDEDKSGTIEVDEFIQNFRRLYEGSHEEKVRVLHMMHSGVNTQRITAKSMGLFFRSFFADAEMKCRSLGQQLQEILTDTTGAKHFVRNSMYQILTPGTTVFTSIGAPNSLAGTKFTATGPGAGTGTAKLVREGSAPLSELDLLFAGDRYVAQRKTVVRERCDAEEDKYDYSDLTSKDKVRELDVGARVKVYESRKVGNQVRIKVEKDKDRWTSLYARNGEVLLTPRMDKADIAMALQKNCANEMDSCVSSMLKHAMQHGEQEKGVLQQREFNDWVQKTELVSYFETMVHLWLVPQSEHTGMARGRPADKPEVARRLQIERGSSVHSAMQAQAQMARASLNHVIKETDIGRTLKDVSSESPAATATSPAPDPMRQDVRWARAFTMIHRSEAVSRHSIRPRTHFDTLTLPDIKFAFSGYSSTNPTFEAFYSCMQILGLNNVQMAQSLFDIFVKAPSQGTCEWCGGNHGHEVWKPSKPTVVFGLMLLVKSTSSDLLYEVFDVFQSHTPSLTGTMDRVSLYRMLGVFKGFCLAIVEDATARISEVCGPEPITRQEEMDSNQFKSQVLAQASLCLDELCKEIFSLAFNKWPVECWHTDDTIGEPTNDICLTRTEFCQFAQENRRLATWVGSVGDACVEMLSTMDESYLGVLSDCSTLYCAQRLHRKYPLGTPFDNITAEDVRRVFEARSTMGKMGPEQFACCLNDLKIHSTFTIGRLFRLFDSDQSGYIEMHEFASSFSLVCSGPVDEKLQKAFAMYDVDASGYLEPTELMSMLKSFSIIGMDAVGCSLSGVADILGDGKPPPY